ncbi:flagellar hook capping FlgD N-terminal domain-containing protein [Alicyclobacillus sp. SO9]|uniref:flagellar hook capping FlgD N-terminal domain-containing protein n=1 Tax=Alicyclobacillus sp. SO9 TaxID=2665646 RepID=UPI0018E807C9|nr:flagellar hook capping FlgD N-terminal domain-containing protein [Alicyclobacillus sp. SO9]QQE80809.1 flagellar hook capping protein [Alicyclobacillus sp. SO9]
MTGIMNVSNGQLGKNAFLQLMVAQMKNQDPLSTQSNTQFVAQLAQFSSLEQMQNVAQEDMAIQKTLGQLLSLSQMNFTHQLLGTKVTVTDKNGASVQGTVSAVGYNNGSPELIVNGTKYPMSALQQMGG